MEALERLEITGELARLISLIGRSVEDPEVTRALGEQGYGVEVPTVLGEDSDWLTLDRGTDLLVSGDAQCRKYPRRRREDGFVPWVSTLHLGRLTRLTIPFGLSYDMPTEQLEELMGPPSRFGSRSYPRWHVPLIRSRAVVLSYYPSGPIYIQAKWDPETYARVPSW